MSTRTKSTTALDDESAAERVTELRNQAAALAAEVEAAQKISDAASLARTAADLERQRELHAATVQAAHGAIEQAQADAATALRQFRTAIVKEPWFQHLVDYSAALLLEREWNTMRAGAHISLVGADQAQPSTTVWTPEVAVGLESSVVGLVSAQAHRKIDEFKAGLEAHKAAYTTGQVNDPNLPTTQE